MARQGFTKAERWGVQVQYACERFGLTPNIYRKLCSLSAHLSRWGEEECNGTIRRDDDNIGPHRWKEVSPGRWHDCGPIRDQEMLDLIQAKKLIEAIPDLELYYQTDPRGVALYLYQPSKLRPGDKIDCIYSSIGHACYRES